MILAAVHAVPTDPLWMNTVRFLLMFLAAVLIGLIYRWSRFERRRWYMVMGAGITLLTGEQIVVHYLRLGESLNWQVPVNLAAFTLLIVSFAALQREGRHRARKGTEKRSHR